MNFILSNKEAPVMAKGVNNKDTGCQSEMENNLLKEIEKEKEKRAEIERNLMVANEKLEQLNEKCKHF